MEGSKILGTSAILFVGRSGRTGPARKGFESSVEMGGGGGAEYGFNLCQDSLEANAGTLEPRGARGLRRPSGTSHREPTDRHISQRPHPRPTRTSRVEPQRAARKGVPRCSEDTAAAIVVLVTYSRSPSKVWGAALSRAGLKWHSRAFFPSSGRRERGRSPEAASQWARAPALSPASAELLTPRLPPPPAPQPPACSIPPDALGSCGCPPRSAPSMDESLTFDLPNIFRMFEDPYAARRLFFLDSPDLSLYCYNFFLRASCCFAYTDGKFIILNILGITSSKGAPDKRGFHCVSSHKTNLCIFL